MRDKLTLYPIFAVDDPWDEEPFDTAVLPFMVTDNIAVEDVSGLFNDDTFSWVEREMGRHDLEDLKSVHYAIVHRYQTQESNRGEDDTASEELVGQVAACLRLIRPMRQRASLMQGEVTQERDFNVQHFEHPVNLMEVPEVQKLFSLRNRDLDVLREAVPKLLAAMHGEYWKIRMAVQFHEGGHWQQLFWKPRFSLWMAGLEALYTTPDSEHSGRLVATERVKSFLGADTNIYEPGDVPSYLPQPNITVGEIVDDIYKLRNYVVHGERVPDEFFALCREGVNGQVNRASVLLEALSFILRKSVLRVLRDKLLEEFKDRAASRRYWRALSLTRSRLVGREAVLRALRNADRPLSVAEITRRMNEAAAARTKTVMENAVGQYIEAAISRGEVAITGEGYASV